MIWLLACTGPQDNLTETAPLAETGDAAPDPRFDELRGAAQAHLSGNADAISIAIWEDGQVVFAEAFGDAREGVPATPATLFQIGSTTKFQTALHLLQAVDAGELSLESSLDEALPGFEMSLGPDWDDQVTLHHLISHQGGFYDWIDWQQGPADDLLQSYTTGTFAQYLWVMSPPGAFWNYSNPNFSLAGAVVEVNGGRAWPDRIVDEVYRPLGMERTVLRRSQVQDDGDYALGWGFTNLETGAKGATTQLDQIPDPGWARPAGLAWSTPTEMLQLAEFLLDGDPEVLSDALRQQMTSPQAPLQQLPPDYDVHYGYGLFLHPGFTLDEQYHPTPVWEHGGNTLHFSSTFYVLPEQRWAISILTSAYADPHGEVLAEALQLVELPAPIDGPELPLDPDGLDRHVGSYNDAFNVGDVLITREGDTLFIDMPLLDELDYSYQRELVPAGTDLWYVNLDGAWYDLTFLGDQDQTTYIRNRAFVATRVQGMAPTSTGLQPRFPVTHTGPMLRIR